MSLILLSLPRIDTQINAILLDLFLFCLCVCVWLNMSTAAIHSPGVCSLLLRKRYVQHGHPQIGGEATVEHPWYKSIQWTPSNLFWYQHKLYTGYYLKCGHIQSLARIEGGSPLKYRDGKYTEMVSDFVVLFLPLCLPPVFASGQWSTRSTSIRRHTTTYRTMSSAGHTRRPWGWTTSTRRISCTETSNLQSKWGCGRWDVATWRWVVLAKSR